MNIVIIGLGWLGNPLAHQFAELGHNVFGTYRTKPLTIASKITQIPYEKGDVKSELQVVLAQADCVIFAFPPSRVAPNHYAETCLEICERTQENCNFILVSSTGVYPDEARIMKESDALPSEMNETALGICEFELQKKLGDRLSIIRMAGLIGKGRYPARFMSNSGKTYAGDEPVNVIHQQDAIGIIQHCVVNQLFGKILNACASTHPMKKEYYSWMSEQLHIAAPQFEESGKSGKTIDNNYSKKMGYQYQYDNPFEFPFD